MALDFNLKITVDASSHEEVIAKVVTHLTTVARQIGSGRDLADCGALFTISESKASAKPVDLVTDVAKSKLGEIELELDPQSYQGQTVAAQQAERAAAKKAEEDRLAAAAENTDEVVTAKLRAQADAEHEAALAEQPASE